MKSEQEIKDRLATLKAYLDCLIQTAENVDKHKSLSIRIQELQNVIVEPK